jgi:hypothetical protein
MPKRQKPSGKSLGFFYEKHCWENLFDGGWISRTHEMKKITSISMEKITAITH